MAGTHQVPFSLNLSKSAKEEPPETARLFDLTEDRFDGLFPQPVLALPSGVFSRSCIAAVCGAFLGSMLRVGSLDP